MIILDFGKINHYKGHWVVIFPPLSLDGGGKQDGMVGWFLMRLSDGIQVAHQCHFPSHGLTRCELTVHPHVTLVEI